MTTSTPSPNPIESIMETIREEIKERIKKGEIPPEEEEKIAKKSLDVPPPVYKSVQEELHKRLSILNYTYDTRVPGEVSSHRKGIGPLIVKGKKWLRSATQSYINLILGRQVEFNSNLVKVQNAMIPAFLDMEKELALQREELIVSLKKEMEDLKGRLAVAQQSFLLLKKELGEARPAPKGEAAYGAPAVPEKDLSAPIDADLYYLFEDLHRGTREEIKERQKKYVSLFSALGEILDIGCGRGEFLELLKDAGLPAYGIDINPHMVKVCEDQGLRAYTADALAHLRGLSNDRLGGIFMAQLVEHLSPMELVTLLKECFLKIAPGGTLIAETINPTCLTTFSGAFYLDLTHKNPLHPESLRSLLKNIGFQETSILFVSPYPEEMRLAEAERLGDGSFPDEVAEVLNRNVQKLNPLLFGFQDYAVIAKKISA